MAGEYVECSVCGARYSDEESVKLVKLWLENPEINLGNNPSPCPQISCSGQMEVKEDNPSES